MGVDLYIGTWSRYLTGNWETPIQKFARETGVKVQRSGPPPRWVSADVAECGIRAFRQDLGEKLGVIAPFPSGDGDQYFALQLTKPSLQALVLCAAHAARPDLELPRRLPPDVQDTPAVSEASQKNYYLGPMAVLESHLFVVGNEGRICGSVNPFGDNVIVSTTAALASALEYACTYLEVPSQSLPSILSQGPPIAGPVGRVEGGQYVAEGVVFPFDEVRTHAAWGLACFDQARRQADENSFSIIRDE